MGHGISLAGRRVLITGGTRGLGRQLALGAATRGAEVVLWARNPERGEQMRAQLGPRASFRPVDVADPEAVAAAAVDTGPIDVLINNAGVVSGKSLLDATNAEIIDTYRVNALAVYWVVRGFLPGMLERGTGTIVTVASAAGLVGAARMTDYAGSKHAAVGFTEALRAELRAQRSRVNTLVVCPYFISTEMFAGARTRFRRLLPILAEEPVARRILEAVEAGRPRLVLPRPMALLPVLRMLPVGAFDAVMDLLGVNRAMDGFTGHR